MRWIVVACIALMLVPTVPAQSQEDSITFWVHHSNADGCCDQWINTLKEDPDHNLDVVSNLLLPSSDEVDSMGRPDPRVVIWHDPNHSSLVYGQEGDLPGVLELDTSRKIVFDTYLGGEQTLVHPLVPPGPNAGSGSVVIALLQGDTVIAETERITLEYEEEFIHTVSELEPLVDRIDPADGPLRWDFSVSGVTPVFQVGGGDAMGHTSFTLPLVVESEVVHVDEAAEVLELSINGTSVSQVRIINWTQGPDRALLDLDIEAAAGAANVTITDAASEVIFHGAASDDTVLEGDPGTWIIEVATESFNGTLDLRIEPDVDGGAEPQEEPETEPEPEEESPAEQSPENTTSDPDGVQPPLTTDEKAPGMGVVLGLVGVAFAVLRRQR